MTRIVAGLMALLAVASVGAPAGAQGRPVVIVNTFPHDPDAFTQGLEFVGNDLYEGTGLHGESDLRKTNLHSGDIVRKKEIPERFFGEGITIFRGLIYQLTWQEHRAFVYRKKTWERVDTFRYEGEGWGLAHNSKRLIMSNGSATLAFRNPETFKVTRSVQVTDGGGPVTNLNELEWVRGKILANVWQTDRLIEVDPQSGDVTASYDLSAMTQAEQQQGDPDVANGIAYLRKQDRLFVTGKLWRHVYEIEL